MFNPEITLTNTPEITVLPSRILLKVRKLLDERKIEYRVIFQDDFPEGCPGGCTYRGEQHINHVYGIEACVDKNNLLHIAEQLYHVDPDDIQ